MRSRKLAGGGRASARLRARSCSARLASAPDAAARTGCQPASSSRRAAADRRAPKKFKQDRGPPARPGPRELLPPDAPGGNEPLELAEDGAPAPRNGADPAARQEAGRAPGGRAGSEAGAAETEAGSGPGEDSAGGGPAGEEPAREAPARASPPRLDGSVFLDDDSNQPMPVSRFFGNVELMQDPPPASASCPSMSRRELRKMHFRAAEDDEDDEDGAEL